eukprot:TRINITY_DN5293_c0_g1_i1.p1 TRINITY_DN5293_c0_g1~~TRINITY_DN5293_c0_g1_i1.p1  ORF type:complete len:323 (-),score=63.34 TRINITY_DN5293_c0_g1_i1:265-1233(-)
MTGSSVMILRLHLKSLGHRQRLGCRTHILPSSLLLQQMQTSRTQLFLQRFASSSPCSIGLTASLQLQQQRLLSPPGWGTSCSSAIGSTRCWGSSPGSQHSGWRARQQAQNTTTMTWWFCAAGMAIFGTVFALVPLYKLYCQTTGQGQAVQTGHKIYELPPLPGTTESKRLVTIDFAGTVHPSLPWEFVPQQRRVVVGLGETALAFYRAKNKSDHPIIGVSVYHMIPPESGLYFNKIQCFCFDEQLINPGEEVDLPIFFFIDPMMGMDNRFDHVDRITLSYLFFESDSDLPEEYEDFKKSLPTSQKPPALAAPKPQATIWGGA